MRLVLSKARASASVLIPPVPATNTSQPVFCNANTLTMFVSHDGLYSILLTIRKSDADGDLVGEERRLVDGHGPVGLWWLKIPLSTVSV